MENISLEWFKSTVEKAVEKKVEKILSFSTEKLFKNVKLVEDVLTVVMNNGSIFTKTSATEEDHEAIINASSEEEIKEIITCQEVKEINIKKEQEKVKHEMLSKGFDLLSKLNDFVIDGDTVYLKGINRSLPQLLVEKFIEIVNTQSNYTGFGNLQLDIDKNKEFQAHKRFFMWCCLNPRAEVADELFRFLQENSFKITQQGMFLALRNVVTLHGSPELVHFVSNTYNKVKAVWKKNPNEYSVFLQNGEYKIVHDDKLFKEETHTSTDCQECNGSGGWYDIDDEWEDCDVCNGTGEVEEYTYTVEVPVNHGEKIGNLVELYLDLPNRAENRFTDDWTKTFDIRIGTPVNMPIEECNWSTQDCAAAGLHFTSDQIHYVGCGDQSVLVMINPMKVVGIGTHKGRCYEYFPFMTVPREEATKLLHDLDFDTMIIEENYAIKELDGLEERIKEGFIEESKKHSFNLPSISSVEIKSIVKSLSDMESELNERVKQI